MGVPLLHRDDLCPVNRMVLDMYSFPFIAFTYGPLLWLYIRHMTRPGLRFSPWNALHFIPFLRLLCRLGHLSRRTNFDDLSGFFVRDRFIPLRIVYGICFFLSVTVYSVLSFLEIRHHQKRLRDLISYTSAKLSLNWMKILSIPSIQAMYLSLSWEELKSFPECFRLILTYLHSSLSLSFPLPTAFMQSGSPKCSIILPSPRRGGRSVSPATARQGMPEADCATIRPKNT
jgi:hypothetical protein